MRPFGTLLAGAGIALSVGLRARTAAATPQWNTALTASGCLLGSRGSLFDTAGFCGSARGDVMFLRDGTRDFGLGPYLAVGTAAFDDLRASLGASALFPIAEDFPLVASVGPLLQNGRTLGVSSSLFWGARSYNFHGTYNLAFGVVLGAERVFGNAPSNALMIGIHVDGFLLALPFLLLEGATR